MLLLFYLFTDHKKRAMPDDIALSFFISSLSQSNGQ